MNKRRIDSLVKNMETLATISNLPKPYRGIFSIPLFPQKAHAYLGKSCAIISRNIPQIYANTILKELYQNPGEPEKAKLVGVRKLRPSIKRGRGPRTQAMMIESDQGLAQLDTQSLDN